MRALLLLAAALPLAASARTRADDTVVLRNAAGMEVRLIPFGAAVTAIEVPDRAGRKANVVLGYATPAEYRRLNGKNAFGATIGRYAGRIGRARFELDGRTVQLVANDGPNALHGGGKTNFGTLDWQVVGPRHPDEVTFAINSPDGFQGFPGRLRVEVRYRLAADNALRIDYTARTTRPTAINLTNHSYFNLAGERSGTVAPEQLEVAASRYVATDARGIPSGALPPVAGTPLDFRCAHEIGERIDSPTPPMTGHGYNHAWVFDKPVGQLAPVARLVDPASGRVLSVETTEPSVQIYTGDYIDGKDRDAGGYVIRPRFGVALETQHLPDSPNQPGFPSTILRPGETFRSTTIWRFGIGAARPCPR